MTQNKTINSQLEDEEYLDEKFPKGMSKLRGEAMVLLALARRRGKQEAQKMFLEEIDEWVEECIGDEEVNEAQAIISFSEVQELKSRIGGKTK